MNRIYRLVFNVATGQVQVASELAAGKRCSAKRTLLAPAALRLLPLAVALGWAGAAQAQGLPTGFSSGDATQLVNGNTMTITQTGNKARVNWADFSIGNGSTVKFDAPSAASVVLNVVTSATPSLINGNLNGNGQVFVINPNGIVFGNLAQVNVAGLVASSLALDQDVGNEYTFKRGNGGAAAVINQGTIKTSGGPAVLLGSAITNLGVIKGTDGNGANPGRGGSITLAAASEAKVTYEPGFGVVVVLNVPTDNLVGGSSAVNNVGTLDASLISLQASTTQGLAATAINMGGSIGASYLIANGSGGALAATGTITAGDVSLSSSHALSQDTDSRLEAGDLVLNIGGDAVLPGTDNRIASIGGTVTGDLILKSTAALVQSQALSVGGQTAIDVDPFRITLNNAGNSFGGKVQLAGGVVEISSSTPLSLGNVTAESLTARASSITLNNSIATDGWQTYDGDVQLGNDLTLSSANNGSIEFRRNLSGSGHDLVIQSDGNAVFSGTTALDSLSVSADSISIGGNVTTSGQQDYQNAVSLTGGATLASTGGGRLRFGNTINGNYVLTTSTSGETRFEGAIGGSSALSSLSSVGGGTTFLYHDVSTMGTQRYDNAVKLEGNVALSSLIGGSLDFGSTVNGPFALITDSSGTTRFSGAVGGIQALDSLTTTGAGVIALGNSVTTVNEQVYGSAVVLTGDTTLTSTSPDTSRGNISFHGEVNGQYALTTRAAGSTVFGADVGKTISLGSLSIGGGGTTHFGGTVRAINDVRFNDAVSLASPSKVFSSAGHVVFGNTVTGPWQLDAGGSAGTAFLGKVDVGLLDVTGGVTTLGADVDVAVSARFAGPVTLSSDVKVSGRILQFDGAINGGHALDLQATTVTVGDDIGAVDPLASLKINTQILNLAGGIATSGDLSLKAVGGLTQGAAFEVGGAASFTSESDITLGNAGNRFDGSVTLDGADVTINASTGLDMVSVQADSLDATAVGQLNLANADSTGNSTLRGGAIDLNNVQVGGNLHATSDGAITQTGAVHVVGGSTLNAAGNITLQNTANTFDGALQLQGDAVAIRAAGNMLVASLASGANAAVTLVAGGVLQVQPVINTGTANLALRSLGGSLSIGNALTGAQVALEARDGISIASDVTASRLSLHSQSGPITQTGGNLLVSGTSDVDAGSSDITLANIGNHFRGAVSLTGGAVKIAAGSALQLDDVTAGSLLATGNSGLSVANAGIDGLATLDAGSGALVLRNVHVGADLIATGALITQTGTLDVTDTATLTSPGSIALNGIVAGDLVANAGNGLSVIGADIGQNASLHAGLGALTLSDVDAGADLTGSGTSITQTGTLAAAGVATLTSAGTIALRNVGGGSLVASAGTGLDVNGMNLTGDASLDAGTGALTLNNVGAGGDLTGSGSSITQMGALTATGVATLTSAGTIALSNVGGGSLVANAGAGLDVDVAYLAGDASLDAGGGALTLNNVVVGGDVTGTGASITQTGTLTANGVATLTSAGTIALSYVGGGSLVANAGTGLDVNGTYLAGDASLNAGSGALTLNNIRTGGNLTGTGSSIAQTGTLAANGVATLTSAGNIALSNVGGGGLVARAGSGLSVGGANVGRDVVLDAGNGALTLANVRAGGNLTGTGTSIRQTGALAAVGTATLTSAGNIALSNVGGGNLVANAGTGLEVVGADLARDASLDAGSGALALSNIRTGGSLTGTGASITQSGTLTAAGTATLTSAGNIALSNVAAGRLSASGEGLSVTGGAIGGDAALAAGNGSLSVGNLAVGGNLQASAAHIGQNGTLNVAGNTDLRSNGDIVLDNAGNHFGGAVALSGQQVAIVAGDGLELGQVDVASLRAHSGGALRVRNAVIAGNAMLEGQGVLTGTTRVGGDLSVVSGAGIDQDGSSQVQGSSSFVAAGPITLDNDGNDFRGSVSASGDGITLVDANDLQVAALSNGAGSGSPQAAASNGGGSGNITVVAGGNLSLPASAIDAGNGVLTLRANGGPLAVRGALAGREVVLGTSGEMTLGADISARDVLDLQAGGGISQTGGRLSTAVLRGQAGGNVNLSGDNRIAALGDFSASALQLVNGSSLALTGNVQAGGKALLDVRGGDLRLDGRLAADAVHLQSSGAITQGQGSSIVAAQLSGRSGGATQLGSANGFAANRVGLLGNFYAGNGFSLTNASTLTLGAVDGSAYSVDAGSGAFYLKVDGGDVLQRGTTPVLASKSNWWSSGGIGTATAPIYLITTAGGTVVDYVGRPPAYFNALQADGSAVAINGSVNLPVVAIGSRAQSGSMRRMAYVDVGALSAEYRAFGIVKPGIRLPAHQVVACDAGDPDAECAQ
jgi:filamentous hemagglutinin family protein